jgi:hypothetical protein
MTSELPDWLLRELDNWPKAGDGFHNWLFCMARQLHAHFPHNKQAIADLLATKAARCGRHVPRREIEDAVRNSERTAWQPNSNTNVPDNSPPQRAWPALNSDRRQTILRDGIGLVDLWELSPMRFDTNESVAEHIVDQLFPGNPLLCCGESNSQFDTKPREEWRRQLAQLSLIVPSPMSSISGVTKEGKESKHTLSNTGPRRFLVVEFDKGTFDDHASLIFHLADYGPLVLAVHSGSKSLHGWFYCVGQDEEKLKRFMRYAVSLGADHATWVKSQFVRMPEGTRENGNAQRIYYFDPEPLEAK